MPLRVIKEGLNKFHLFAKLNLFNPTKALKDMGILKIRQLKYELIIYNWAISIFGNPLS